MKVKFKIDEVESLPKGKDNTFVYYTLPFDIHGMNIIRKWINIPEESKGNAIIYFLGYWESPYNFVKWSSLGIDALNNELVMHI
jgi:hypothetical protein